MTAPDYARLRSVAEAATPGEWRWTHGLDSRAMVLADDETFRVKVDGHADAAFIAAWNPQTARKVLDERDELLTKLRRIESAIDRANAMRPDDFKTGQNHLAPAFREINYRAAFEALVGVVNEVEAALLSVDGSGPEAELLPGDMCRCEHTREEHKRYGCSHEWEGGDTQAFCSCHQFDAAPEAVKE